MLYVPASQGETQRVGSEESANMRKPNPSRAVNGRAFFDGREPRYSFELSSTLR